MLTLVALVIGIGIGAVVGLVLQRVDAWPVVRSAVAMSLSWQLAVIASGILWLATAAAAHEIGAVTINITATTLTAFILAIVGAALHHVLDRQGAIQRNRLLLMGTIGGATGAMMAGPVTRFTL